MSQTEKFTEKFTRSMLVSMLQERAIEDDVKAQERLEAIIGEEKKAAAEILALFFKAFTKGGIRAIEPFTFEDARRLFRLGSGYVSDPVKGTLQTDGGDWSIEEKADSFKVTSQEITVTKQGAPHAKLMVIQRSGKFSPEPGDTEAATNATIIINEPKGGRFQADVSIGPKLISLSGSAEWFTFGTKKPISAVMDGRFGMDGELVAIFNDVPRI